MHLKLLLKFVKLYVSGASGINVCLVSSLKYEGGDSKPKLTKVF